MMAHASLSVVAAGGLVPEAAARGPRRYVQPSTSAASASTARSFARRPVRLVRAAAAAERAGARSAATTASCSGGSGAEVGGIRRWNTAGASGGGVATPRLCRRNRRLTTVHRPAIVQEERGSSGSADEDVESEKVTGPGDLAEDWENVRASASWDEVEEEKVAEALAEIAADVTKTMSEKVLDEGEDREGAAAIKAKAATYASLTDIVLDFNPEMTVAEKLLLIGAYFGDSPAEVASRLAEVTAVAARLYAVWTWEEKVGVPPEKRTRALQLRDGIASLGPVFVKMAQTLSTRPDVIGQEAADSLTILQDQMTPFSSDDAYKNIREELNYQGPIAPVGLLHKSNPVGLYVA